METVAFSCQAGPVALVIRQTMVGDHLALGPQSGEEILDYLDL